MSAGGQPVERLDFTNRDYPGTPCRYVPERFTLSVDLEQLGDSGRRVDLVRLLLPPGWLSDHATERRPGAGPRLLGWTIFPKDLPSDLSPQPAVELYAAGEPAGRLSRTLPVVIEAHSQFDPAHDVLPWSNSVDSLGVVKPRWEIFRRSYALILLPWPFFRGLYGQMVRLDGSGGGLCSGMAHLALERSLTRAAAQPSLDDVLLWHGRQLSDRALLASAPWFLRASPRAAYDALRAQLSHDGRGDICFDIAQPSLRHPRFQRVMSQGHTVLPYAVRQSAPDRAEVLVYDPNDPAAAREGRSVITFDLAHDTYAYPGHATAGDGTTVFAPRQTSYRGARTAFLSSLASLVMFPRSLGSGRGLAAPISLAGVVALVALLIGLGRERRAG